MNPLYWQRNDRFQQFFSKDFDSVAIVDSQYPTVYARSDTYGHYWRFFTSHGIELSIWDEINWPAKSEAQLFEQHHMAAFDRLGEIHCAFQRADVELRNPDVAELTRILNEHELYLDKDQDIQVRKVQKRAKTHRKVTQKILDGAVDLQAQA